MKINEFSQNTDTKLPFDIVEDAIVFMRNDPQFYRKQYFPAIAKVADLHRAGKKVNADKALMPMIEKGCDSYVQKYNIGKFSDEVFTQDDRKNLLSRIFAEELNQIENGDYT